MRKHSQKCASDFAASSGTSSSFKITWQRFDQTHPFDRSVIWKINRQHVQLVWQPKRISSLGCQNNFCNQEQNTLTGKHSKCFQFFWSTAVRWAFVLGAFLMSKAFASAWLWGAWGMVFWTVRIKQPGKASWWFTVSSFFCLSFQYMFSLRLITHEPSNREMLTTQIVESNPSWWAQPCWSAANS